MIIEFECPIGNDRYFPSLHIKIDKTQDYLYCVVLTILWKEETIEISRCDNFHGKGDHIHFLNFDGTKTEKQFQFEGIGKTIDYFQENWEKILEEVKNE